MNKILSLRIISPAFLDATAFSCNTLSNTVSYGTRCLSTTVPRCCEKNEGTKIVPENKDIKVNPLFTNRNPRALEQMGLAPKRKGWKFQAPRKDFYNKLVYDSNSTHAYIEHWTGKKVVEASSKEPNFYKYLYNAHDVSANRNLGHLLAQRMLQAGITNVLYEAEADDTTSLKRSAFLKALKENQIELSEPEEIEHEVIPGIDYDGFSRLNEPKKYMDDYQLLDKREDKTTGHPLQNRKIIKPKWED